MCERIIEKFHPLKIILFGSRARGGHRPDSDVDLLVVMASAMKYRENVHAIRQLVGDIPVAKDILIATPEQLDDERANTAGVIYDVLNEGKVVYERSS
jgi:predicted nucleotidyltransferase